MLDGGATTVGVESTVLDVAARAIYRPGAVTAAMIAEAIGEEVRVVSGVVKEAKTDSSLRYGMTSECYGMTSESYGMTNKNGGMTS